VIEHPGQVGKIIPFERGGRKAKVIRLVPNRRRRHPLEKMIGPKGLRALRWVRGIISIPPSGRR
jgi:hypothetical protein